MSSIIAFFFFSSRRRHTRWPRDWSSNVCSSDLRASAWRLRMWNGRGEQMLTVFLPNPWIDPARQRYVDEPDWSRLTLWMRLRERFAGVPVEPPPAHAE